MTLAKVLDLAGKPVAGLAIDRRSRTADGELMYESTADQPHATKLLSVEIKRKAGARWLYWTWEPLRGGAYYDCGFSGVLIDGAHEQPYHILIEALKPPTAKA